MRDIDADIQSQAYRRHAMTPSTSIHFVACHRRSFTWRNHRAERGRTFARPVGFSLGEDRSASKRRLSLGRWRFDRRVGIRPTRNARSTGVAVGGGFDRSRLELDLIVHTFAASCSKIVTASRITSPRKCLLSHSAVLKSTFWPMISASSSPYPKNLIPG